MRREERGPWYLLTGLLIGIALGLAYAWWLRPVAYTNTTPASLGTVYKDQYRSLIATAYMANNDLVRARGRLELLEDDDMYRALAEQAQRTLAEGTSVEEARALGLLAVSVGQAPSRATLETAVSPTSASTPDLTFTALAATLMPNSTLIVAPEATPGAIPAETLMPSLEEENPTSNTVETVEAGPAPSPTATLTETPLLTSTSTPALAAQYLLEDRELVCDQNLAEPLIQVQILDSAGQPVPGARVVVGWESGEDFFFTGLKPELGLGYGDFTMTPGINYTLQLAESGELVSGLTATECGSASGRFWGSWRLTFTQP